MFAPKLARDEVDPIGTPRVLANFVRDGDDTTANSPDPMIETVRYAELLKILPDKIVNNLEKARLAREGNTITRDCRRFCGIPTTTARGHASARSA